MQAGLAARGLGPNATEQEIKTFFQADWNNSLRLTLIAEHSTACVREILDLRIKALDFREQLIKLVIVGAIIGGIALISNFIK